MSPIPTPTPSPSNRTRLAGLGAAGTLAAALLLSACGGATASAVAGLDGPCRDARIDVVDASSSAQTSEHTDDVVAALTADLEGAAYCKESIDAVAVAGGRTEPILTTADIEELHLRLPTDRAVKHRIAGTHDKIESHVRDRLEAAFAALGDADSSPIEHLYEVADETVVAGSRVVIFTDGVEQVEGIDLDRALRPGQGARIAETLAVPTLPSGTEVVIAGVGQTDRSSGAGGAAWVREIKDFNRVLCRKATESCRLLSSVSVAQLTSS